VDDALLRAEWMIVERRQQLHELGLDPHTYLHTPVPLAVLKTAYRLRAKQTHPDSSTSNIPLSPHPFHRLSSAYSSLLRDTVPHRSGDPLRSC
jgi:hypothetical protein